MIESVGIPWHYRLVGPSALALVAIAAPEAAAKCCPLDYVTVSDFRGVDIRIEASELAASLEEWELQLVSWPVLNGTAKGDDPPPGPLGRGYLVTYVHSGGVSVRERVYPFAKPGPVAFTLPGQTQHWTEQRGRVHPVPWGWRPVPEGVAAALFGGIAADRSAPPPTGMGLWRAAVAGLVASAGVALVRARARSRTSTSAGRA